MSPEGPDPGFNPSDRPADTARTEEPVTESMEGTSGGRFRWNRGGWFGGQLGATLWLVLLGLLLLGQGRTVGIAVLVLALAANAVGFTLWRRREAMEPYPAIQILIGSCGLAALLAVLLVTFTDPSGQANESTPSLLTLLIYPGLMLVFHLQERSARKTAD